MSQSGTRQFLSSTLCAYPTKGKASAVPTSGSKQFYCFNVRAYNNSGSAINVGILQLLSKPQWNLYDYTALSTSYTNVTASIQSGSSTQIFSTTNNDGFLVSASYQFGMIGMTVSTSGASGVYTYKYWNGTSFTTLTTLEVPAYSSTADIWVVFQPPADWVAGGGPNASQFAILIQGTTAPANTVNINNMWLGRFLELYEAVPNNAVVQLSFPDSKPLLLEGGCGVIPYFATAAAANQVATFYALA